VTSKPSMSHGPSGAALRRRPHEKRRRTRKPARCRHVAPRMTMGARSNSTTQDAARMRSTFTASAKSPCSHRPTTRWACAQRAMTACR